MALSLKADIDADVSGFRAGAAGVVRASETMATATRGVASAMDTAASATAAVSDAMDRQASAFQSANDNFSAMAAAVTALAEATRASTAAAEASGRAAHAQITSLNGLRAAVEGVTRAEVSRAEASRKASEEGARAASLAASRDQVAANRDRWSRENQAQLAAEREVAEARLRLANADRSLSMIDTRDRVEANASRWREANQAKLQAERDRADAQRVTAQADRDAAMEATRARVAANLSASSRDSQARIQAEREAAQASVASSAARAAAGRDTFVPLHRETRQYVENLKEIRRLERDGTLTSRQASVAIRGQKDAYAALVRETRNLSSGQLAGWQKRNLMSQGFDVFSSAMSGMPLPLIAVQQGPQIIEAAGGIKEAMALAASAITPVTAAVTAAAAAVAIGGAAWNDYLVSTKEVATAASGLGRNIGASTDELERIAQASASAAGLSVRSARTMEAAFLRTGRIGVEHFGRLIEISEDFGATIGADAETAARKLADLFRDPTRGAQTLAQDMGLLDGATARYVQRLAAAGREEEARSVLLTALPGRLASAADATTAWSRAWDKVATAAGNAWDAIGKAIDRAAGYAPPPTPAQRIQEATEAERSILYEQLNRGTKNKPVMEWVRKPEADAIEARAARLTDEDMRTDGPRERAGASDPYKGPAIELKKARQKKSASEIDRREQAATPDQDRIRAQSDAAVTRAYGLAQGSAGASTEQRRRQLQQEIGTLQGGLDAGALGNERADILATLEAKTRVLRGLETQQARNAELDRLDVQIQSERNPQIRAGLIARQAELRIGAEEITDKEAATRIEQARAKAYAEAGAAMSAATRERQAARADEVASIDRETAAIGQSAGAIAGAEAAARALAEAKRDAGAAGVIDPAEIERIRQYGAAVAAATDRQAAAKAQDDLAFERAQLDRTPPEQRVAETLRSARIDPASAEGQRVAGQVREIEGIKAQREALADLRDDMAGYLDQIDAAADKWETAGDIAEGMLQQLVSDLRKYAIGSVLGVQTPAPGILQMFGIGRQAAQPPTGTPAPAAAPASGLAPATLSAAPVTAVKVSALPALSAAYRGGAGGLEGLDQTFGTQLDAFLAANPGVNVNSAYRTPERQRVLWEDALAQWGSPEIARRHVAPPGASYHNKGLAADLAYSSPAAREQAHATAGQYGLKFPLSNENWHVEPAWTRGGRDTTGAAAAIDRLAVSADGAASATDGLGSGFETVSNALQAGGGNIAQAAGGLTGAATKLTEGAAGATESAQGLFATIGSGLDSIISGIGSLFSVGKTGPAAGAGAASGSAGASAGGIGNLIFTALSAVWPFEAGGVMTARGPLPLRAYATGGIASSPQLALYGEGAHAEAYVPLPDGRTIPVTMRTTGGSSGGATMVALTQLAGQLGAIQSRLAATTTASGSGAGGVSSGSGTRDLPVTVIDNVGAKVSARETRDSAGNRRLEVVLDEQMAKAVAQPGSKSRRALAASQAVKRR